MATLLEDQLNIDICVEFLEVAFHCVLYHRGLYPQGVFEKRLKYNVPVQMCLHPDVKGYIASIAEGLRLLFNAGTVDSVSLVVLEEGGDPKEKFVFEIGRIKDKWKSSDPHLFKVEQALRGFLLKLNVSDALMQPAQPDLTWTVHAHTKDSTLASVEEKLIQMDFPWMEADQKELDMTNTKIIPVKSISTDIFDLQMYIEEAN